jgi:hypothetical protein
MQVMRTSTHPSSSPKRAPVVHFMLSAALTVLWAGCGSDGAAGSGASSTSGAGGASSSSSSSTSGGSGSSSSGSSSSSSGGGGTLAVNGKITAAPGKMVPAMAGVEVAWSVSSGSPDYLYVFGAGPTSGNTFSLSLDKAPPVEALNSYGIGVGIVFLFPASNTVPEGNAGKGDIIFLNGLGAAGRYAVIYKAPGATDLSWSGAFAEGYSCGKGAPPPPGQTFEIFTPVDCSEVEVVVDDLQNIMFVNWT